MSTPSAGRQPGASHELIVAELRRLIDGLADDDEETRRAAMQILAALGWMAFEPLLEAIALRPLDGRLRHSYLYVLEHETDLDAMIAVWPVCEALRSAEFRIAAPPAAFHVLEMLNQGSHQLPPAA